jgi:hypothetical protein
MKMVCGLLKAIVLYLLLPYAIRGEWTLSAHTHTHTHTKFYSIHLQINRKFCIVFFYTHTFSLQLSFIYSILSISFAHYDSHSFHFMTYIYVCNTHSTKFMWIFVLKCGKRTKIWNQIDVALLDLQGPIFVHEPPYKIEFSNNTGGHIHCSGHANPYPEVI